MISQSTHLLKENLIFTSLVLISVSVSGAATRAAPRCFCLASIHDCDNHDYAYRDRDYPSQCCASVDEQKNCDEKGKETSGTLPSCGACWLGSLAHGYLPFLVRMRKRQRESYATATDGYGFAVGVGSPTLEESKLWRKTIAMITTMAMKAMINAYSTRPWPSASSVANSPRSALAN